MDEEVVDPMPSSAPSPAVPTDLLSPRQAAEVIGVSRGTISGWIAGGALPVVRIGSRRCIAAADLAAVYARCYLNGVVPRWRQERTRCGQRLRLLREAAGLSQLALATVTGFTHEAISRWEVGNKAPYAEVIRTLADALHVAPEQFVADTPLGLTELSVREAARQLGVPVKRTQRWIREGELPGRKVSGQWRVPAVAVRALGGSGRLRGQSLRLDPRYRG
jgi:excisionase family DNA binding protein